MVANSGSGCGESLSRTCIVVSRILEIALRIPRQWRPHALAIALSGHLNRGECGVPAKYSDRQAHVEVGAKTILEVELELLR